MIWILYIVGSLVGLVALMALIGLTLPVDHVAARCAVLAKPVAEVWSTLVDVDAYPRWRRGLRSIEHRIDHVDAQGGKPCFREVTSQGAITYVVDEARAPTSSAPGLRITRIADDRLPFGGRWIYELASDGGGSR